MNTTLTWEMDSDESIFESRVSLHTSYLALSKMQIVPSSTKGL